MTTQQVNDTIISLLEAKGYHPSVGRAFCMGLDKTGRFTEIREIVCGLYKKRIFYPKSQNDLDNPDRLFQTRRRVLRREKKAKFYPPYRMDKRETLLFSARYPEVEVIHRAAKHDNPHAFHANCRHVSTEILLGFVREHSYIHELDSAKVIDVGGNEAYHTSRGRTIHCDTPMLSARDRARYLHREIYSGSTPSARCTLRFGECTQTADFAIAVHSTYDMTPRDIAIGMHRRGIKAFFGVLVIPTNLEHLLDGVYQCDGTDITVKGDDVSFDFPYDASVRYSHKRSVLLQYLMTRGTLDLGGAGFYAYRVISIRGDTLFFSVVPIAHDERVLGPPMSVVPPQAKYYIHVPLLTKQPLEVDAQPFDRMVLTAAAARNFQSYDIVNLYQYAKSLRQSLTINNVPLSHGYGSTPAEVVVMVVAAYCVAASFRSESTQWFKQVTSQVDNTRNRGFFLNLYSLTSGTFTTCIKAVLGASGTSSMFGMLDSAIYAAAMSTDHVTVSVSPTRMKEQLVIDTASPPTRVVDTDAVAQQPVAEPMVPPVARMGAHVSAFERYRFFRLNMGKRGERIFATSGCHDQGWYNPSHAVPDQTHEVRGAVLNLPSIMDYTEPLDAYASSCNEATLGFLSSHSSRFKQVQPVQVTKNGDYSYIQSAGRDRHSLVVRGLGSSFMVLMPPPGYKRRTVTFALRYDYDITDALNAVINDEPYDGELNALKLAKFLASGKLMDDDSTLVPPSSERGSSAPVDSSAGGLRSPSVGTVYTVHSDNRLDSDSTEHEYTTDAPDSSDTDELRVFPSGLAPVVGEPSTPSEPDAENNPRTTIRHDLPAGYNALAELRFMNDAFVRATVTVCDSFGELAKAVDTEPSARAKWRALSASLPSEPTLVRNVSGKLRDALEDVDVDYGGVCWQGRLLSTRRFLADSTDGDYAMTTNDLVVFVTDGIASAIDKYSGVTHDCEVVLEDAPAGNGKTYYITTRAELGDYVVSETRAACDELRSKLLARDSRFKSRCFTADSAIINDRTVDRVEVLYIDEALRLHAGKIYLLMRMLKPARVMCFGDSRQIPAINFLEGYDFVYNSFPFTSTRVLNTSRTMLPCFAMALSKPRYYGREVYTHSKIVNSTPVRLFLSDETVIAKARELPDTVILTYTRVAKADYRKLGIQNVFTIGDVQGQRFDHVVLVRERDINKVLYFDVAQTLTAVTRARKSVTYLTASVVDDSAASALIRYIDANHFDIASHLINFSF